MLVIAQEVTLQLAEVASQAAVLRLMAAMQAARPVCWRCWPLPGTPRLTLPAMVAGVMSIRCYTLRVGSRYSVALFAAIRLVLSLAAAQKAPLVVAQARLLQLLEAALQDTRGVAEVTG